MWETQKGFCSIKIETIIRRRVVIRWGIDPTPYAPSIAVTFLIFVLLLHQVNVK